MEDWGRRSTIHYATTDMNEEGKAHNGVGLTEPDLVCEQDPLAVGQVRRLGCHCKEGCKAGQLSPPKTASVEVGGGRGVVETK